MRRSTLFLVLGVVALVLVLSSVFIVDEREKALVLQFGQIQRVEEEPGLSLKAPFIQNVVTYDDRILSLDTDPIEVTPSDDRRLVVDAFARYRIVDVVRFRQAVGVGGLEDAQDRLESILREQIRAVLGADGVTSNTILSADRSALMARIRDTARDEAEDLGLQVVDVRLKQTALPEQNLEATFLRMRAEREREATDERARGAEAAQRVRALADRTVVELVSEARREAEITRGEADAERNAIFGEAFGSDPEFFEFYRSLTAYQRALQEGGTTMVMNPDSEFFNYLRTDQPNAGQRDGQVTPAAAPTEAPVEAPAEEAAAPVGEDPRDAGPGEDDSALIEAPEGGGTVSATTTTEAAEAGEDARPVLRGTTDPETGVAVFTTAEE